MFNADVIENTISTRTRLGLYIRARYGDTLYSHKVCNIKIYTHTLYIVNEKNII